MLIFTKWKMFRTLGSTFSYGPKPPFLNPGYVPELIGMLYVEKTGLIDACAHELYKAIQV